MRQRVGLTLMEALLVVAIIALLAAILMPTLTAAREQARMASCSAGMYDIHAALMGYASANNRQMPPFIFSDLHGSLPESGHYGGPSQPGDPAAMFRGGDATRVNLWALVEDGRTSPARLLCPGTDETIVRGDASYFEYSFRFSTYCLRFPASEDLFSTAPALLGYGGEALSIYRMKHGGATVAVAGESGSPGSRQVVPQVRFDCSYRTLSEADCGDGDYIPAEDAMLVDTFWWRNRRQDGGESNSLTRYPIRAGWCHGEKFNVLYGSGAVKRISDDGSVKSNSVAAGNSTGPDKLYHASAAERIWQFFDAGK